MSRQMVHVTGCLLRLLAVMAAMSILISGMPLQASEGPSQSGEPRAIPEHQNITEYSGPSTCVGCHPAQAQGMFGSDHYQLFGPTPNVPNVEGDAGKGLLGFNTYCGTPVSSSRATCGACHAGYGRTPSATQTPEQLNNIDCLLCHQDLYLRKLAGPFATRTFTDYLGVAHTWQMPIHDPDGSFYWQPDEAHMTVSILDAARTVHLPSRKSCLRCHAYAGGADGTKRGDLSSACENPATSIDFHMSPLGANLSCQSCHQSANHHLLGRGLDLLPNDRPEALTCTTSCHSARPHGDTSRDNHAARIACQTCHIPHYAKGVDTEIARNWNAPFWSSSVFSGQGGYKPGETRASNLTPSYKWYDLTSNVYVLGQVPAYTASTGKYEMGLPLGTVRSPGSKIHPMKEHSSIAGMHNATSQLIPHSTFKYFATGNFAQAVADGMVYAGLTGGWTQVSLHTYQTINHGTEPASSALLCGQCHASLSGGPARMNLGANLGYAIKGPQSQVCRQCHGSESMPSFSSLHNKHVSSEHYDCAWCHNFSRPERGLIAAPGQIVGDMNCDRGVDYNDIPPFVLALTNPAGYAAQYPSCSINMADVNGDGVRDGRDVQAFLGLLQP
jgi:hypothetical protein